MLNLNRKVTLHKLCEVFFEACFLLALGLILSDWRALKWRPSHLSWKKTPLQVAWPTLFHHISFSFLHLFHFFITPFIFVLLCSYFPPLSIRFPSCLYVSFHVHLISALHHQSPYTCIFPLPSRSEPSHLLNHLVKFVSNRDLLWVLTI